MYSTTLCSRGQTRWSHEHDLYLCLCNSSWQPANCCVSSCTLNNHTRCNTEITGHSYPSIWVSQVYSACEPAAQNSTCDEFLALTHQHHCWLCDLAIAIFYTLHLNLDSGIPATTCSHYVRIGSTKRRHILNSKSNLITLLFRVALQQVQSMVQNKKATKAWANLHYAATKPLWSAYAKKFAVPFLVKSAMGGASRNTPLPLDGRYSSTAIP